MRRLMARLTVHTRNDHGVALFAAIAGMVVLSTMIAALVILARNEGLIAQLNKDEAQAAYAAEAGANWGRRVLHQRLSVDLATAVAATPRPAMKIALNTTYNSAQRRERSSSGTTRSPRAAPSSYPAAPVRIRRTAWSTATRRPSRSRTACRTS